MSQSAYYDTNPYAQNSGQRTIPQQVRYPDPQYGGDLKSATQWEADRASGIGGSRGDIFLDQGKALGADAYHGMTVAGGQQDMANKRAGQMYDAAGQSNANQLSARGDTMGAIGRLRSFYEQGPGPSAAQAQLLQGQDANARNAMSIARSGGPAGGAAAQRRAQGAAMVGGQQTNQAAAGLRAQEDANWRGQKLNAMGAEQNALSGVRQGDAAVMGTQLGAGQGAAQTGLGYGQLGATYGQQNIAARQGMGALAGSQWATGEGNRGAILGGQLNADTTRYGANFGAQVNANAAETGRADRERAAALQTAGTVIGGIAMSDASAKTGIRPVSSLTDAFSGSGGFPLDGHGEVDPDTGRELTPIESQQKKDALRKGVGGAAGGSLQALSGMYMSDRTTKSDVRPASEMATIMALDQADQRGAQDTGPRFDLRPAQAYSYEYKDPARHGQGEFVGPMAQDLEHLPGVVQTQADGKKAVDTGRVAMVTASAVGEQQKEIDRLKELLDQAYGRSAKDTGPRMSDANAKKNVRPYAPTPQARIRGERA